MTESSLTFNSLKNVVRFYLSCLDDPLLVSLVSVEGSDARTDELGLNRIYFSKVPEGKYFLLELRGDAALVRLAEQTGAGNGADVDVHHLKPKKPSNVEFYPNPWSIDKLMRSVVLQPASPNKTPPHVLLALWGDPRKSLGQVMRFVWGLSVLTVDLAFIKEADSAEEKKDSPSHFLRIQGLQRLDALVQWCADRKSTMEVYVPHQGASATRFYVKAGLDYPLPGLDRLCEANSDLILMREKARGQARWLTFPRGQIDFIRRSFQMVDLKVEFTKPRVLQLDLEEEESMRVPVKADLVAKPVSPIWSTGQLDREIERQKIALQNLENQRLRLAGPGLADQGVYFAYRFDQPKADFLNPLLARLMQQRLGTLDAHSYAFCKPHDGPPFHVVIADMPQRQVGFSLQLADRVYYQPESWRQQGLRLFLPIDQELVPRVDSEEAIPMMQQILEASLPADLTAELRDPSAILWDKREAGIRETRIASVVPLLSQVRLLNAFQRQVAGAVQEETRRQLVTRVQEAQQQTDEELKALESALLDAVSNRTTKLENEFTKMEEQLRKSAEVIRNVEPLAQQIQKLVQNLPNEWVAFVNDVLKLNTQLCAPKVTAWAEAKKDLRRNRQDAVALRSLRKNLVELAERATKQWNQDIHDCRQEIQTTQQTVREVEDLAARMQQVLVEINERHRLIQDRQRAVEAQEKLADKMVREIDEIDQRERAVKKRIADTKSDHDRAKAIEAALPKQQAEVEIEERKLAQMLQLVTDRKLENDRLLERASAQLAGLQADLEEAKNQTPDFNASLQQIEKGAEELQLYLDSLNLWEQVSEQWQTHQRDQRDQHRKRRETQSEQDLEDHA